ncbi:MAG: hypothetical protein Q9191_005786 [Dirinaria sp. TL-2023a]
MPHAIATFNGHVIAEADGYEFVEGNVYFPPDTIKDKAALTKTESTTFCPWKGTASYYNITIDDEGKEAKDAAWYYPQPTTERAAKLKDHIAFCQWN